MMMVGGKGDFIVTACILLNSFIDFIVVCSGWYLDEL